MGLACGFYQGSTSCCGCPETIAVRNILEVAGKKTVIVNATSCLEIVSSQYPRTSWGVNYIHGAFENASAIASGVSLALEDMGKKGNVIAMAGDGGTLDIGLQALSGSLERGDKICFVCLDNNAYMNTGIQRSSATPLGAWTTTSPHGRFSIGKEEWKKPIVEIVAAHRTHYIATASVGFIADLKEKVKKALEKKNQPSFIHVECPCPLGWKFDPSKTIEIAKIAVETGMWMLYEVHDGNFKITKNIHKRKPVEEYLRTQGRFSHLFKSGNKKVIKKIQDYIDNEWEKLLKLSGGNK
ncbi:MAG: pyruvate synthase subunit beta [Candidatus Aenigmarchaeota archaeon]|nr:pyruvate synthase subunit beta [Candidatus Aenigmarchaeota archaeon]NIQ18077.1 pyruvate synthase subunit beta [Candidatus Aenigmarchaeota archaeon]